MGNEQDEERGFTISDKRGQGDDDAASEGVAEPKEAPIPEADFPSFLLSLATSALFHMGLIADPESGEKTAANLPLARHSIDTLALLQEKTQGNLTSEEEELLTNLLTELRMRFVDATK